MKPLFVPVTEMVNPLPMVIVVGGIRTVTPSCVIAIFANVA